MPTAANITKITDNQKSAGKDSGTLFRLSKKSNRRKTGKKEKGFSLEEKLSTKLTDEGPRKRQKWQHHYISGTSCRPLIRQSQGDCHLSLQGEGLP